MSISLNHLASLNLGATAERPKFAAVYLDFENVYYFFKNGFFDPPDLNDHILELLRNLRGKLAEEYGLDCIVLNAYADFERLASTPQGALYLLGVDTKNVMGTDHKNAADMRLCIDVLETLYTRPEIGTFVLVAGDRDYIPVIQHLRRQARRVLGVGFRESVSGDLLLNLGENQFLDARDLLDDETLARLENRRLEGLKREEDRRLRFEAQTRHISSKAAAVQSPAADAASTDDATGENAPEINGVGNVGSSGPNRMEQLSETAQMNQAGGHNEPPIFDAPVFAPPQRIEAEDERYCLEIILEKMHRLQATRHTSELWLGPFLRQLTDEMPSLAEFERRRVLDGLTRAGAISVEKRQGEPYPYSVVIVNYQHPDVWELNPG